MHRATVICQLLTRCRMALKRNAIGSARAKHTVIPLMANTSTITIATAVVVGYRDAPACFMKIRTRHINWQGEKGKRTTAVAAVGKLRL